MAFSMVSREGVSTVSVSLACICPPDRTAKSIIRLVGVAAMSARPYRPAVNVPALSLLACAAISMKLLPCLPVCFVSRDFVGVRYALAP